MDRAQEKQFIDEHASSWQAVKGTWLAMALVIGGIALFSWSPLTPSDVRACPVPKQDWYHDAPRLQHSDDEPDEFRDPSNS